VRHLAALALSLLGFVPHPASAADRCAAFATGGTVTLIAVDATRNYCVHRFTNIGNSQFVAVADALDVEYLIVGGGGGGGQTAGGGGGGGGLVEGEIIGLAEGTHNIVVGQGGTATANADNNNGGNSSFNGLTALGGGAGAVMLGTTSPGRAGGSGGGGNRSTIWGNVDTLGAPGGAALQPGSASGGFGHVGGAGRGPDGYSTKGGGGGGAGSGGQAAPTGTASAGAGGAGRANTITGASIIYAGGGGGGGGNTIAAGGAGGAGGGGAGSVGLIVGNAGANGLGGGGGGGGAVPGNGAVGGAGGSGIVILRYVINTRPTANAGPDQSAGSGAGVTLDGSASTPAVGISYSWSQTAGPSVTLTGANTVSPSITAPVLSACQSNVILTFSLTLTDSFGLQSVPDTVTITVTPPPCQGGGIGGSAINEYNDPNGQVTWRAHSFFSDGTLTLSEPKDVEYLIVGGGGGGGNSAAANHYTGGGGGAGGVLQGNFSAVPGNFPIVVGAGGGGGINAVNDGRGGLGQNSTFNGQTAIGGGGGGGSRCCMVTSNPTVGGSGGGGGAQVAGQTRTGAAGTAGQGHAGGDGMANDSFADLQAGGGGGGAGGPGGNGAPTVGGAGGVGVDSSITGQLLSYAGGGGGGKRTADGVAGAASHGGGRGGGGTGTPLPEDGDPSTGGGGGGAGSGRDQGGAGGSGIVNLRYVINTRPTANAGPDATVFAGQVATLNGAGSTDPDNNITTYAWVQTGGTSVTLSSTTAASPTFTPAQPVSGSVETLTFQLTVTDAFGLSHVDTVTITLQWAPVLTAQKTVIVFSEDGSGCADANATPPADPVNPAAIPGACMQYTISVQNTGPAAAQAVNLTDTLPANLTLINAFRNAWVETDPSFAFNFTPGCSDGTCSVEVENGIIPANATTTITIRATVN
jgi:uncharacterized repeat protein (TIGR01451 family)